MNVRWGSCSRRLLNYVLERRNRSDRARRRFNQSAKGNLIHQIRHNLWDVDSTLGRRSCGNAPIRASISRETHPDRKLVSRWSPYAWKRVKNKRGHEQTGTHRYRQENPRFSPSTRRTPTSPTEQRKGFPGLLQAVTHDPPGCLLFGSALERESLGMEGLVIPLAEGEGSDPSTATSPPGSQDRLKRSCVTNGGHRGPRRWSEKTGEQGIPL